MLLEISQNSQENTCARASFLIKLQAEPCNFIKKETLAQVFSCEFCEFSKNTSFTEHLWATISEPVIDVRYGPIFVNLYSATNTTLRSSPPWVFLGKGVLKICSKFTGEYPCRSVISIKLQSFFIEIILLHGFSPANLLHIFKKPFPKNTSGGLLLNAENI